MSALNSHAERPSNTQSTKAHSFRYGTPHATIDFETRSKTPIKLGPYRYALDESTEILCLSWRVPGGDVQVWHPWLGDEPWEILDWVARGGLVEAHNAEFEYAIWNYVGSRRDWPKLGITQVRCSAAKAAALSLPRALENVALALKLPVQKDMAGRRLMLRMTKPRSKPVTNPKKLEQLGTDESSLWVESFEEVERLIEYNKSDVITEEHASDRMPPLIEREEKTFQLTAKMNERGIYCDVELCKTAVKFATKFKIELEEKLFEITGGAIRTAKQNAKLQKFLKDSCQTEIPNMQAPTVAEFLLRGELDPLAREVLTIRQSLAKSSITKYQTMIACAGPDNRIRGTLLYHGAGTGRYSGKLIQPQNYAKPKRGDSPELVYELLKDGDYDFFKTIFPDVFAALAAGLRGMLCAPEGRILYDADFNAIEARVIQWLAGDEENLKEYYGGLDSYKTMAALIFGVRYDQVTKEQRELGKRAVLGCGFGMGEDKFFATCEKEGFPITKELAAKAVAGYRKKYAVVRSFWYELERTAIAAVKAPGKLSKVGNLQFLYRGGYLFCRLPSGRCLAYPSPTVVNTPYEVEVKERIQVGDKIVIRKRKEKKWKDQLRYWGVHPKTKKWVPERTYGGKLAENVTQAVARDVMVESMFRVEASGYDNVFTVHDEIVCETDDNFGTIDEFEELMAEPPAWATTLPIKVEGWREKRYRK